MVTVAELTLLFSFLPQFSVGSILKEKNLLLWSKFFSLRVDPFGRVLLPREANRKSQRLSPFVRMVVKGGRCSHAPSPDAVIILKDEQGDFAILQYEERKNLVEWQTV